MYKLGLKHIVLSIIIILALISCPVEVENNKFEGSAKEFVASMKIGWNLGNSLDAHNNGTPSETAWGNAITTQSLINAVAAQGFGAVRIPVTWINKIGDAPNYKIDDAWLSRVAQVVSYVRNAGMIAIINIHHDGGDSHYWLSVKTADITGTNKENIDKQFTAVWTQIANRFKDTGNFLVFEGFNELHDGSWSNGNQAGWNRVNELNQLFVNTVRATGGNNQERYLVVSGWVTRPSLLQHLVMPKDSAQDKLIVNFHYYDPYNFSGDASWSTWGSKSNTSNNNNWANESHVRTQFNNVKNWFPNVPVIIGEYGAVRQQSSSGKAHRLYYMEYVTKHAIDCGFIPFYWDNGGSNTGSEGFGLFRRNSPYNLLSDAADVIRVIMKAVNEDYLLSDITPP